MAEVSYTIPGSVNFKRLRAPQAVSTTVDTPTPLANPMVEHLQRYRTVEGWLNHKLYHRYASSQNYYYLKDINHILGEDRSPSLITYKDGVVLTTPDELLKKYYRAGDYKSKVSKLCEYYKFHKEIPRIFAKEVYDTFFDHHDQKRKVEFVQITKRLREEAGEDVKGELEEGLRKIRETPFSPLITGLVTVAQGYKKGSQGVANDPLSQSGHTVSILQQRLTEIFANGDSSYSVLRFNTLPDEGPADFARHLAVQTASNHVLPQTGRFTVLNSTRTQTMVQPGAQPAPQGRFVHSMMKAALSPEVVENLKKISLPDRSSVRKKPTLVKKDDSISSKSKGKLLQKAFTREPSQTGTARNKSSHSIKRGLTLVKRTSEDSPLPSPSKKEFSDFRITKKGTFELEGSLRKSSDRKEQGYLLGEVEDSQKGLASWQGSKPVLRRVPSTTSKGSFQHEATDRSSKKTTDPDQRQKATPGTDLGFSFKVDIERLLKASGIMDYKPSKGCSLTRAVGPSLTGPAGSGSMSKHKHTKSGPETLRNFGSLSKPVSLQVSTKNSFARSRMTQGSTERPAEVVSGSKITLGEHRPYLGETLTFGQQSVKLVKKGHVKKGSNRF